MSGLNTHLGSDRGAGQQGEFFRARIEEQRHAAIEHGNAVRAVAGRALDAPDCRELLEALGLDPATGR